jgi:hypothetical protein
MMGKSLGFLMGLCCKQSLEYSSDHSEKSLLKTIIVGGVHGYPFCAYTVLIVLRIILALSRY